MNRAPDPEHEVAEPFRDDRARVFDERAELASRRARAVEADQELVAAPIGLDARLRHRWVTLGDGRQDADAAFAGLRPASQNCLEL
ncbi:hypothetical protein [Phenylobacterium sp. SCN 70-31]|uniref:hypothetical protein n=1 Tax=Phenylobacterium sp. SCN 70-31 TaxID=1660129 RepID=UPI0025FC2FE2|nr:hypothetical protein [Phenylobacterium sp. SCN 70-31]